MTDQPLWDLPSNHDRLVEHVEIAGRRVIDVGCGAGGLVRFLRSQGADPVGVECGDAMIHQAREADPDHVDAYLDGVGQDLPIASESADVVVFSYSLHHVPVAHMAAALSEATRVLRPGGELVVLEPIPEGPGFETHRLVDDETEVRAHAQSALDGTPADSLSESVNRRYTTSYSYVDMADLEKTVVDIDPERQQAFVAAKEEVARRFVDLSEEHGGRYWFAQPVRLRVFTKS